MENQDVNQTNPQSGNLSNLKKMFSDYQKEATTSKRRTSEEILAKFFVPRKTKEIFRILPPKQGRDYIEKAFFHVVPTTIAGGKKKYNTVIYCPAHNDPKRPKLGNDGQPLRDANGNVIMIPAPCPLCEKAKKILTKQDNSIKMIKKENLTPQQKVIFENNKKIFTEANVWEAKKFYIVRGIDKGNQKDGVKFWRFKHNFRKQGTYDKLMPVLNEYVDFNQADFTHPVHGTDLSITMADSEFNGRPYKAVTAINTRGKSPLHTDPIVVKQWLDDDITWRDIFKPRSAPLITPYQYLEMVANDCAPYWEDSDPNNKHWVFPNNPEMEKAANTRTRNLDSEVDANFEQASDIDYEDYSQVTVGNVKKEDVGTFTDDAVELSSQISEERSAEESLADDTENDLPPADYDDLPF